MQSLTKELKKRLEPVVPKDSLALTETIFEDMLQKCISFYTEKEATLIVDMHNRIVEVDAVFRRWFGDASKEVVQKSFGELVDEVNRLQVQTLFEDVHAQGYAKVSGVVLQIDETKLHIDIKAKEIHIKGESFILLSLKNKIFDYTNFMLNEIEREVANLIIRVKMFEPLLRELIEIFIRSGLFDFGWVAEVDTEHKKIIPLVVVGDEKLKEQMQNRVYDFSTFAKIMDVLIAKEDIITTQDILDPAYKSQIIFPLFKKWSVTKENEVGFLVLVATKKVLQLDESERLRLREVMYKINVALSNILLQKEMNSLLHTDPLTKLPLRDAFFAYIQEQIKKGESFALALIDIDKLVRINNVLGFWAGDEVLVALSEYLQKHLQKKPFIARVGTDEFAVVFRGDTHTIYKQLDTIIEFNEQSLVIEKKKFFVTISVGVVFFPEDVKNAEEVMIAAEEAVQRAKKRGGKQLVYANKEIRYLPKDYLELEYELKEALQRNEYELFYQPIIDLKERSVWGVEALLRWRSPKRGLVSPGLFIPILEESGLINEVGDFILDSLCQTAKSFEDRKLKIVFSMNLSVKQMFRKDMADQIIQKVKALQIDPQLLVMELTESVLMENVDILVKQLQELDGYGIKIEIDDFGTGYSSLSYLKNLPIENVKIDRIFIREIEKNEEDAMLVRAIVSMAHALKKGTIAEGVETYEQLRKIQEIGVDLVQGFYFAKPMTKSALQNFLDTFEPTHFFKETQ